MLTLFSAPKPFHGQIGLIQRNALASWAALGPQVQLLLVGDEPGMAEAAAEFDAEGLRQVERNQDGTPLVSSVFALARRQARHELLCYVNADILLLDDFLPGVERVSRSLGRFLMVGQRWDLEVTEALAFDPASQERLRIQLRESGQLHPPAGSDYFVFRKGEFEHMPPFALGRAGWDNWMIYAARAARLPVVDATESITIVHQSHDYRHLPNGQPHYRLPESEHNLRLAGGREMIFTLRDATWTMEATDLHRRTIGPAGLARTLEAALIARLGPGWASRWVRVLFHPGDALRYAWSRLRGPA